ncbi:hypothetical protein FE257_000221 [Aspergillus nanangensis]|uniref:Uncharacterized protein n=1 Tax=Aspergillus nanangensis TaxID=2582783 RepID=A0AAD4GZQ7_ASPNN|nr:hypothetical protein FE257_000221 [Aspergillus nanangensis]
MDDQPRPIHLSSSEEFYMSNEQGERYLIQISWPLYIVDGNSLFLTATENAWLRATSPHYTGGGIVVSIGYPLKGKLFDHLRRSYDLTPPTVNPIAGCGGADVFLDFIEKRVRPAVKARFPQMCVSREALYGHSYGGLFVLHALFTRPSLFDCYMASSPSIWFNDRCILQEADAFLGKQNTTDEKLASFMVFWGSLEQSCPRRNNESDEEYRKRKEAAEMVKMADNILELCGMLRGCQRLHTLLAHEYDGEEHTSVMACSMSRSLTMFFEGWPLCKQ